MPLETLTVRPPWPDELPRLKPLFRQDPLPPHSVRLFVLAASHPERIVGAAGLRAREHTGELRCRLRPRLLHEQQAGPLVEAVLASARAQGLRRVTIRTAPESPEDLFWRGQGFEILDTEERWRIDLATLRSRLEPLARRWQPRSGATARNPAAEDASDLAALFTSQSAATAERLRLRGPDEPAERGCEGEISTVIASEGKVIAALLLRGSSGSHCHLDLQAAPDKGGFSLRTWMLHESVQAALKAGYVTISLAASLPKDQARKNLARRSGGSLTQSTRLLGREI